MTKTCFIISAIAKEGSQIRKSSDYKFDFVYSPILRKMRYDIIRSDKISSPGSISREIVQNLIDADLVIADITDENSNVFYELAIRNAIKKPVIIFATSVTSNTTTTTSTIISAIIVQVNASNSTFRTISFNTLFSNLFVAYLPSILVSGAVASMTRTGDPDIKIYNCRPTLHSPCFRTLLNRFLLSKP